MDLRTFRRPAALHCSAPPAVGDPAPVDAADRLRETTGIVAFLRHVGCPFAEKAVRDLSDAMARISCTAVSHGDPAETARWLRALAVDPAPRMVDDPDRTLYAAWGLGLTSLGHFAGAGSLRAALRLAANGIRNRHPSGTRWQAGGTFAVDESGTIVWRHLPVHAGDLPDLGEAIAALGRA